MNKSRMPTGEIDPKHMCFADINAMLYALVHMYIHDMLEAGVFEGAKTYDKCDELERFSGYVVEHANSEREHGCRDDD